jgi:GntR family transcriptional regulator / MocR family aminotransferase
MNIFRDNPVSFALDTPLYQQLYIHLRNAILNGDLKRGMQLPSTRALANELNVSRNTVLNAYQQLIAEGYLAGVVDRGTFVARMLPEHLLTSPRRHDPVVSKLAQPRFSDHATLQMTAPQMSEAAPSPAGASPRPFRFGIPALEAFP